MRTNVQNKIAAYMNAIRGSVDPDHYAAAVVLIEDVKMHFQQERNEVTADQLYVSLLEAADKLGIKNPFHDKDHFLLVYKKSLEVKHVDWEDVILQMASASKMPVLPKALLDVYKERFSTKPGTVLIAEAEKFVPNLRSIVDENMNSTFVLTTQNAIYAQVLEKAFAGYDNVEVLVTDIYHYEFINQRFDLILACPNFGGRMLSDEQNFMCREFDMVALENLSLHLNSGGRLIIVLPGRITFASGRVSDLRQFIQTTYTIKEIGELPEGTIEYSGIKVYLLDIENNRPQDDNDIVIRRYGSAERKARRASVTSLEVTDDTFVMLSELEEQGDWNIDQIFAQQDEDYLSYQRSGIRKDMITPYKMMDLFQFFTLYATDSKYRKYKVIARYQQYEGANMIVDRVRAGYPKKGLIWHFQGSGKSYLMEFAAVKLRMLPDLMNPTVLIVDDRLDLESQITAQFHSSDVGNLESASTREQLMTMLRQDIRKIIITTIFRFQEVTGELSLRDNIIVMVDECHRTQEGDLGIKMRAALPNAFFFGLTGTPINRIDKNTFATFGATEDRSGYMSK